MKVKRIICAILTLTIFSSLFTLTGCKEKKPEPLPAVNYTTIPVKETNELARQSAADTAIRYFYLINFEKYELANELMDREDLFVCTPEILKTLYSGVQNFSLSPSNRVVAANVLEDKVTLTFIDLKDNEMSFDKVYEESEVKPVGYKQTTPCVANVTFANSYTLTDVNKDKVIDETDMLWTDNPSLNPKYKPSNKPATSSTSSTSKTTSSGAKEESVAQSAEVEVENSDTLSNTGDLDGLGESVSFDSLSDEMDETSEVAKPDDSDASDVVFPAELYEEQKIVGYKTYKMEIDLTAYDTGFKVRLPKTLKSDTKLMIKVPDEMTIEFDGFKLDKSNMNLDDFYVIEKLPKVSKFTLTFTNKISGTVKKELDLTKRVYYIFSSVVPEREMKDQVLQYIKPALQSVYNDMLSGVKSSSSSFFRDFVSPDTDNVYMKYWYDKYQLEHNSANLSYTYNVASVRFPEDGEKTYRYGQSIITADDFRITNYNYIEVPVVAEIHVDKLQKEKETLYTKTYYGIVKLTRDYGQWSVWDIDSSLLLEKD